MGISDWSSDVCSSDLHCNAAASDYPWVMTGWAILFSALAMTAIVGVRYLITSGAFALATRLKHPGLYRGLEPQMRREIGWSLASAAIYGIRSEEHTSELLSLMHISYAVFCLKKKKKEHHQRSTLNQPTEHQ